MVGNTKPVAEEALSTSVLSENLAGSDLFISKVDTSNNTVLWTVRDGTKLDDTASAVVLDESETNLFVGGTTFGDFKNGTSKGISDIYLAKYSLNNDSSPRRNWTLPRVFGTSGSDGVSALKVEGDLVYGVGHSGGSLFGGSGGEFDVVLFAVDAKTGSLKKKVQVGTGATERGVKLAIGTLSIVAASHVERRVNKKPMTNIQLHKFSKDLEPIGDVLLRAFAAETAADVFVHPRVPSAVFVVGTSKIDDSKREDAMFRRVDIDTRDVKIIGSKIIEPEHVEHPQFVTRHGGAKASNDYARAAAVHRSGRVLVAGFTTGSFGQSAGGSVMEPFVVSMDARNGSMEGVFQDGGVGKDWRDVRTAAMHEDKLFWAGQAMDYSKNTFYAYVGKFDVPKNWTMGIDFSRKATPNKPRSSAPTTASIDMKTIISVASGLGGCLLLFIVFLICMRCCKKYNSG